MDYTMVQSIYIEHKYMFIKNHLLSVDQWLSLIFLKITNYLLVGNLPMQGGSRLSIVEAPTGFNAAPFTSRSRNTFYKLSYSFQGKILFIFGAKVDCFLYFQLPEDLGNFPMHTKVTTGCSFCIQKQKILFIIFPTPSRRKKYFL